MVTKGCCGGTQRSCEVRLCPAQLVEHGQPGVLAGRRPAPLCTQKRGGSTACGPSAPLVLKRAPVGNKTYRPARPLVPPACLGGVWREFVLACGLLKVYSSGKAGRTPEHLCPFEYKGTARLLPCASRGGSIVWEGRKDGVQ